MKRIEAPTLEAAYRIACDSFGCSMTELKYEIVQYPSKGILGLFAKPAIIVATVRVSTPDSTLKSEPSSLELEIQESKPQESISIEESLELEIENSLPAKAQADTSSAHEIVESFFNEEESSNDATAQRDPEAIAREIEEVIRGLMRQSCFDIDTVEVDVMDSTAYIFLDGEDAALLIGKEGYRYNALSYLLYNWIHSRYDLFVKLEVAQFLSMQQEMIRHHLQPVIEHVRQEGWGRTRPLDGILVQIALEQLRETFPDKYVAIKRQKDGERYVLVNDFNSRRL